MLILQRKKASTRKWVTKSSSHQALCLLPSPGSSGHMIRMLLWSGPDNNVSPPGTSEVHSLKTEIHIHTQITYF